MFRRSDSGNPFSNFSGLNAAPEGGTGFSGFGPQSTSTNSYVIEVEEVDDQYVETAEAVEESRIGRRNDPYYNVTEVPTEINGFDIGTFGEERARRSLHQLDRQIEEVLSEVPGESKKKRKEAKIEFAEQFSDDEAAQQGPVYFARYQGAGGTPLAPKVEERMIGLMQKAGKYRGAIDKLSDKLNEALAAKKKLEDELESTKNELDVAKMVSGQGGDDWRRRLNTTGGNANAAQQAALARQKREEERRKMFSGLAEDEDELLNFGTDESINPIKRFIVLLKRWWKRHQPFGRDLLMVESRYGNSVGAYFIFFRWLFVNAMILFAIQGVFMFYHVGNLYLYGVQNILNGTAPVTMEPVQWSKFEGIVPSWALFSNYSQEEAVQYTGVLFGSQIILLVFTIQKTVAEDRKKKVFEQVTGNSKQWTKLTLNGWDHSYTDRSAFSDQMYQVAEHITVKLHEDATKGAAQERSKRDTYILYAKRFVLFLLYMIVQVSGWSVIIYLTANSRAVSGQITALVGQEIPLDIVPIAVSVINAVLPAVITKLTELEGWESQGDFIKQKTTKIFMAKTFNVIIQLFSYAELIDPYMYTQDEEVFGLKQTLIRENTEKQFTPGSFQCRADQAGSQIFGLVATEFVMGKILALGVPFAKYLVAKVRKKKFKKAEFDVALKMIGLLYFQQLVLMSPVFLPISGILSLLLFYINFKFDIFVLRKTQSKPKKPWSAKDAGAFFLNFYIFSIGLSLFLNHSILRNQTQPKLCEKQIATIPLDEYTLFPEAYQASADCLKFAAANPSGVIMVSGNEIMISEAYPVHWCSCARPCGPYVNSTVSKLRINSLPFFSNPYVFYFTIFSQCTNRWKQC